MRRTSVLIIDNYDSFTWNLVHYLQVLGAEVRVERNDAISAADAIDCRMDAILLSPGPGSPDDAGISRDVTALAERTRRPLLGICLGLQVIADHFGASIGRAPAPVHGKVSTLTHEGRGLFEGLPQDLPVTRYHSLVIDPASVPECLQVTGRAGDGTIQAVQHKSLPIHAVQFHPESVATASGHAMLSNFLALARIPAPAGQVPLLA